MSKISTLTRPARPTHPALNSLQTQLKCDVCIVGGGLTGLWTALLCAQSGRSVVLLERGRIGSGETSLSSGHVTEILDARFANLIRMHGREKIQYFTEAHRVAIHRLVQWTEQLLGEGGAGWTRVPGYLFTEHDHQVAGLRRELELLSGLHISSNSQRHTPLPFPVIEAIRVENQGMIDPNLLVPALLHAAQSAGIQVYEESPALEIEAPRPPHRNTVRVSTPTGTVAADWCILATHSPTLDLHPVHFEMTARRTYILTGRLKTSTLLGGAYWDMNSPYHYIRPTPEGVMLGGHDHDVGAPPIHENEVLQRLEDFARARFEIEEFTHAWSGTVLESADGLPYLGHSLRSDRILFATGYGGNGISLAMLAASLLHEVVEGSKPELWSMLSPFRGRHLVKNARTWISLGSNAFRYLEKRTSPLIRKAPLPDPKTLAQGEACIGQHGDQWVALSRDENGKLHSVSARCSHLGAELHYNELEKTWDCPCHGSRFSREGRVLCGPALRDLEAIELGEREESKKEEAA